MQTLPDTIIIADSYSSFMRQRLLVATIAISVILLAAYFFPLTNSQSSYLYPYSAMNGDSLSSIGQKFNVEWSSIARLNGIAAPYIIYPGESILIPLSSPSLEYSVKSGDTLYGISHVYEITWQSLAEANALSSPYTIYVGETLVIPLESVITSSTTQGTISTASYTVQSGDSLYTIGQTFGVSWQEIAQLNGIKSPYTIYVGEILLIPGPTTSSTTTQTSTYSSQDNVATGNALYDQYDQVILSAALKYGVDPLLIKSQIAQESYFNSLAVSPDDPCGVVLQNGIDVGHSYGLMQVTPACSTWFAKEPDGTIDLTTDQSSTQWSISAFNPEYNIYSGASIDAWAAGYAEHSFAGCTPIQYSEMALAIYNAGSQSVYGCGLFNSIGTMYVSNVLGWYQTLSSMSGSPDPYP